MNKLVRSENEPVTIYGIESYTLLRPENEYQLGSSDDKSGNSEGSEESGCKQIESDGSVEAEDDEE